MLTASQTMEHGGVPDRWELEQMIAEVANGNRDALAAIYQNARGAVYAMALSYLKNGEDAQDITQDTFVRVWEKANQYRPQGSPMAWILTIAKNLALMKLRQGTWRDDLSEQEWQAIPAPVSEVSAEDRTMLQEALAKLEGQERQVVLLHAVSGLKHREIAALLELRLPTVLSKYHRALKKIRAQIEGDDVS